MNVKRVAVTGAAGVIGRELLFRLVDQGTEILSLDRVPLAAELASRVNHVQVDLAFGGMEEISKFEPDIVYHLAAAFERSVEEPEFWDANFNDNILVSHRLHELLRNLSGVSTYVFASSYLLYQPELYLFDRPPGAPRKLKESDPLSPRNLCGSAKYYAEREITFLRNVDQLPLRSVSARIYRVYGRGSRDVISRWVRALLQGRSIEIYNPENAFDYVFASDVAEGLMRLAGTPAAQGPVNLATGRARSIQEVVEIVKGYVNQRNVSLHWMGSTSPFEASAADTSRLKTLTGWVPQTDLENGVKEVIQFERTRQTSDTLYKE